GMAASASIQVKVRLRYAELFKKYVAHFPIVVLPSVDETPGKTVGFCLQGADDGRDFHEVRPRPGDKEYLRRFHRHCFPPQAASSTGTRRPAAEPTVLALPCRPRRTWAFISRSADAGHDTGLMRIECDLLQSSSDAGKQRCPATVFGRSLH